MKNYRYLIFYILTIGGFSLLMYIVLLKGDSLNIGGKTGAMSLSVCC